MNGKLVFRTFLICVTLLVIQAKPNLNLYELNNSNVINLNPKNFDSQITANRAKSIVSIVHYYKLSDEKSKELKTPLEKFASDFDGMFKVGAINCQQFAEICEKNLIKEFPTFMVYPPLPAPVMPYDVNESINKF